MTLSGRVINYWLKHLGARGSSPLIYPVKVKSRWLVSMLSAFFELAVFCRQIMKANRDTPCVNLGGYRKPNHKSRVSLAVYCWFTQSVTRSIFVKKWASANRKNRIRAYNKRRDTS